MDGFDYEQCDVGCFGAIDRMENSTDMQVSKVEERRRHGTQGCVAEKRMSDGNGFPVEPADSTLPLFSMRSLQSPSIILFSYFFSKVSIC